jgi:hypothetical protein
MQLRVTTDWSDVLNNLFWFLSRGPEQVGHGTQDLNVRIVYLAPGGGIPPIKVFYAIDPGEVTLNGEAAEWARRTFTSVRARHDRGDRMPVGALYVAGCSTG